MNILHNCMVILHLRSGLHMREEKTKRKEGIKKKLRLSSFKRAEGFPSFFLKYFSFASASSFFRELSVCHLGFKREIQEDSARGREGREGKHARIKAVIGGCE